MNENELAKNMIVQVPNRKGWVAQVQGWSTLGDGRIVVELKDGTGRTGLNYLDQLAAYVDHSDRFRPIMRNLAGRATTLLCTCSCGTFEHTGNDISELDKAWAAHRDASRLSAGWTAEQIKAAK